MPRGNTAGTRFEYSEHAIKTFKHLRVGHRVAFPFRTLREWEDVVVYEYTNPMGINGPVLTEEQVLANDEMVDRIRSEVAAGLDDEHTRDHPGSDFLRHMVGNYHHTGRRIR